MISNDDLKFFGKAYNIYKASDNENKKALLTKSWLDVFFYSNCISYQSSKISFIIHL